MKATTLKARTLLILLFFLFLFLALSAVAAEREPRTIRVAYPAQDGLTMQDGDGALSDYTYDYLMEISQYTGWNYEFVSLEGDMNEQILTFMEMLKTGKIDLMGGLYYNESLTEDYSYPGYCYGNNYVGLFVPEASLLTEASLYTSEKIQIGVYSQAGSPNQKLAQFADMNQLDIEQIVVTTSEELRRLVIGGEVHGILSTDLAVADHKGMRAIAHFSPTPFYFATQKGNVDIVRQLDFALSTINQVNPNFAVELYNRYFSKSASSLQITPDEAAFVQACGPLDVVIYSNKPPFQFLDSKTGEPTGITVEVLQKIAEATGLTFRYKTVSSYQEYMDIIQSGAADIAGDTFLNYQDAADMKCTLSVPWRSLPVYMLFREGAELTKSGTCALPYFMKNVVSVPENTVFYDTVEECLNAVQSGQADYCYAGEFCSQYLLNSGAYSKLRFLNQFDSMQQKLCFGIRNTNNFYLLSLVNKAITHLPAEDVSEIIYRNTYLQQDIPLLVQLKSNQDSIALAGMVVVALLLLLFVTIKNREQHRIAFENNRYNMLSNLANEYFYEYDPLRDTLNLSDKCAASFSCEAHIHKFSKRIQALPLGEQIGIWQLGHYIITSSEETQEVSCVMPDHSQQWFKMISSVLYNQKHERYLIGKISDIQDAKSEQLRLEQRASLDGLTHIYNIATIKQLIRQRLQELSQHVPCALIILDIDNFKQINDQFGHYNGDAALVLTANLISANFPSCPAGRLGGDEFIIFAERTEAAALEEQCHALCKAFSDRTDSMLGTTFTLSIGAAYAENGLDYTALYQQADTALYQVKSTTKNGFALFQKNTN